MMKRLMTAICFLLCVPAIAQTAPTVSLSVATGNVPTITWNCQAGAAACTASGSWSGTKANSGSQSVTAITDTATYVITATVAGKDFADLTWPAPTQNTDGSSLTDLAGYEVWSGASATALTLETTINSATTLTYHSSGNAPGARFYAVKAFNTAGVRSAASAVVSITMTAVSSASASVTIKVPKAPTMTGN